MARVVAGEKKVGVVFSSGFFGFFAHAGFLAALREAGIKAQGYSGASSGAILAAMAACGMQDQIIREALFRVKKADFWDPDPLHVLLRKGVRLFKGYPGYLRGEGFGRLLRVLPAKRIEECEIPLAVAVTNLTQRRETIFTRGDLTKALQASGAVPILFKPVEIRGALYVDGGVVNKAPVRAVADLIRPQTIIVHYIASRDMDEDPNAFLKKKMTPWHIHSLSVSIAREEAYRMQLEMARYRGIEVIEIRTKTPALGPNRLDRGPEAYEKARSSALRSLKSARGLCLSH